MRRVAMAFVLGLAAAACAHAPPTTGMGGLRVKCCDNLHGACPQPGAGPDASRVSIDGVFAGLCGEWPQGSGREVRAGRHLVVVDPGSDLAAESHDVVVPDGGTITVQTEYTSMPE